MFFARIDLKLSLVTVTLGHIIYVFPYFLLIAKAALDLDGFRARRCGGRPGGQPVAGVLARDAAADPPRGDRGDVAGLCPLLDEFVITFFVIGSQSTLPLYIWSSMRRTIDPSINTISTLLMLVTLVMFAIAFALTIRKDSMRTEVGT